MSAEFDALLAKTEYDKAIKSLVAAVKASAGYQARAEKAEAALARVAAIVADPHAALVAAQIRHALKESTP